jgi:hypothetical protein
MRLGDSAKQLARHNVQREQRMQLVRRRSAPLRLESTNQAGGRRAKGFANNKPAMGHTKTDQELAKSAAESADQ